LMPAEQCLPVTSGTAANQLDADSAPSNFAGNGSSLLVSLVSLTKAEKGGQ
jgi:hypothetical protein